MTLKKSLRLSVVYALWGAVILTGVAFAQEGQQRQVTDDEVNSVAKQLYCPVCENIPLDVCPTQACAEWRELIRLKLSEGWTPDQVKSYFADQYGDRVLATPPARGLNWLVYILPPLGIAVGIYILYRAFVAWKGTANESLVAEEEMPIVHSVGDKYIKQMEEELKNR